MPRNQADIGTLLRVSTSVVVEKITLGLESISKLEFKLISAEYLWCRCCVGRMGTGVVCSQADEASQAQAKEVVKATCAG